MFRGKKWEKKPRTHEEKLRARSEGSKKAWLVRKRRDAVNKPNGELSQFGLIQEIGTPQAKIP